MADLPDAQAWMDDVRLTVTYFDTLRRYQQLLDPSAYFRTAWLMDNKTMRERGIVEDYLRHPNSPSNLALETMLITASVHLADQQFSDAAQILAAINSVLDGIENGTQDPFSVSPLTVDYLSISSTLKEQGYEVQSITIHGDSASTNVSNTAGPDVIELHLTHISGEWSLSP